MDVDEVVASGQARSLGLPLLQQGPTGQGVGVSILVTRRANMPDNLTVAAERGARVATGFQVTFDCAHPQDVGDFWAGVLGYKVQDPPPGYSSWQDFLRDIGVPEKQWDAAYAIVDPDGAGPRLYFQKVPEPKSVKNRVHLDVNVGGGRDTPMDERKARVNSEVERVVGLGATKIEEHSDQDEYWVVMQDVEGNEFCLQ
jgi:hypothetical protein